MAKKLDPQEIEQSRRKKTRADNREERKERIHDGIRKNRESGGVIIIPPPPAVQAQGQTPRKMRVAAYVRVSTQEEQQVGSFEMQIVYFKSKIESNPDWELVKIYQDYGVSGTSTNKRQGFKDMIDDAKAGKIDLILTKGINRFGRNTVDILNNLRTLNALTPPVPVRFESEGLSSIGDGSNNLLIAVLSALAELESQQKSEAIKNGIRWRMAEGIYQFSVINTLGYYWDHFGRLLIEPTEAKIVEYIYESCLEGATPAEIAAALNLHESTISRAVTGKFFQCKWGVYPLRSLFTHRIHEADTDQVLLQLQELIAAEPAGAAYSDQQLAEILSQDGVHIARRTVVKYRQKLGIPTSRQRNAHKRA